MLLASGSPSGSARAQPVWQVALALGAGARVRVRVLLDQRLRRAGRPGSRDRAVGRLHLGVPAGVRLVRVRPDRLDARLGAGVRRRQPGDAGRRHGARTDDRPRRRPRPGARDDRVARRPAGRVRATRRCGRSATPDPRTSPWRPTSSCSTRPTCARSSPTCAARSPSAQLARRRMRRESARVHRAARGPGWLPAALPGGRRRRAAWAAASASGCCSAPATARCRCSAWSCRRVQTPVHDHLAWGLVGLYRGTQDEEIFARERRSRLSERRALAPGDFYALMPPADDVHRVRTTSAETSVSIHLLTNDTGCMWRHAYDPASGEERAVPVGLRERGLPLTTSLGNTSGVIGSPRRRGAASVADLRADHQQLFLSGSQNPDGGGTRSPMRLTSSSTSTPSVLRLGVEGRCRCRRCRGRLPFLPRTSRLPEQQGHDDNDRLDAFRGDLDRAIPSLPERHVGALLEPQHRRTRPGATSGPGPARRRCQSPCRCR